jgi:rhodanese-related sulfurtransferase
MKYPALLNFMHVLPMLDEFDAIIDVRTEVEFALDHIPGAINCPVLDDQQRIEVGTMYKQVNSFEAKKVGAAIVSRNIARHIETLWLDKPRDWKAIAASNLLRHRERYNSGLRKTHHSSSVPLRPLTRSHAASTKVQPC